jgi:hypothetical protein
VKIQVRIVFMVTDYKPKKWLRISQNAVAEDRPKLTPEMMKFAI